MEQDLLSLLETFISFSSTADRKDEKDSCLDWVCDTFFPHPKWGIVRDEVSDSPYAFLPCPHAKLLWFGHIDVIPGSEKLFSLSVKDEKAFGRGVVDMKGCILPFLLALKTLQTKNIDPPVSILFTSDEEIGGHTIPTLLSQNILNTAIAFTPDAGGESHIVVAHKGALWLDIEATGKSAHAAWPWRGINPITLLSEAIESLKKTFPDGKESEWNITVTPTRLSGGDAQNKIPDVVRCSLDIRYPPENYSSHKEVLSHIQSVLPDGVTTCDTLSASSLNTNPDHPMVLLLQRIANDVMGKDVPIGREHGASDARFFHTAGIPAFLYSPEGGGPHSEEEWVSIPSLLNHVSVNQQFLEQISEYM